MSLYHEAECGHSVEFGRKCQQCAHAKQQAEIESRRAENAKLKLDMEIALSDTSIKHKYRADVLEIQNAKLKKDLALMEKYHRTSGDVALINHLKQAVQVFREALLKLKGPRIRTENQWHDKEIDHALERGDAILKGKDAGKENGK